MEEIIGLNQIKDKIVNIRNKDVILDFNVAEIYGVDTKRINEAVRRNLEKFPKDYIISMSKEENNALWSQNATANNSMSRTIPKAFTEKGLYMLATILKTKKAVQATIDIIETFAKMKEMTKSINELHNIETEDEKNKSIQNISKNFIELFNNLESYDSETTFEINLALVKLKHTMKNKDKTL